MRLGLITDTGISARQDACHSLAEARSLAYSLNDESGIYHYLRI